MFLRELNEKEKELFLHLSVHAAKANGVVESEERAMISDYCREMEHGDFDIENIVPLENILEFYNNESNFKIKRIVLLEMLGLLYSDGSFDNNENDFFNSVAEKLGVDKYTVGKIETLIRMYLQLYKEMQTTISE